MTAVIFHRCLSLYVKRHVHIQHLLWRKWRQWHNPLCFIFQAKMWWLQLLIFSSTSQINSMQIHHCALTKTLFSSPLQCYYFLSCFFNNCLTLIFQEEKKKNVSKFVCKLSTIDIFHHWISLTYLLHKNVQAIHEYSPQSPDSPFGCICKGIYFLGFWREIWGRFIIILFLCFLWFCFLFLFRFLLLLFFLFVFLPTSSSRQFCKLSSWKKSVTNEELDHHSWG